MMINKKINKPHSTEKAVECGLFWLWSDQNFLDIKQITVNFQCSVSVVCKYTFCKDFTKLYTLLVEAVQIPEEALEHDLVLKVCQKCTKGCMCKLLTDDNTGRTSALKVFIQVLIFFAAGESYDLSCNVCAELLLAGAVFNINIYTKLTLLKSDELQRNDVSSLM